MADAEAVLDEAIARAADPAVRARAEVEREFVRLETETSRRHRGARRVADARCCRCSAADDDGGQGRAWSLRAQAAWDGGRVGGRRRRRGRGRRQRPPGRDERELY